MNVGDSIPIMIELSASFAVRVVKAYHFVAEICDSIFSGKVSIEAIEELRARLSRKLGEPQARADKFIALAVIMR